MRYFDNKRFSEKGNSVHILYSPVISDSGVVTLVESGKEDINSYIASFKNEVDIDVLISRYMNGDMDALNKVRGTYGDFTKMPKTYAEMLQLQFDVEKAFNKLPVEIKEKFDNDFNKFFVSLGTDEFEEKISVDNKKEVMVENEQER